MATVWTIEDFLSELGHLGELSKMRPDSLVVKTMTSSFIERIQAAKHWTSAAIIQLLQKVEEMELPKDMKENIQGAIEKCQANEGTHLKLTTAGQKIQHVPCYLTQAEWTLLESTQSKDDMMQLLAKRLRAMGLSSLKEGTIHQVLATILYVQHSQGRTELHPRAIHGMVEDFSAIFHGTPKTTTTGLAHYPENPKQNGQAWLAQAYGDGASPACRALPLHAWMKKVPMRKNHYLLQEERFPCKTRSGRAESQREDSWAQAARLLSDLAKRHMPGPAEPQITMLQRSRMAIPDQQHEQQQQPLQQQEALQQTLQRVASPQQQQPMQQPALQALQLPALPVPPQRAAAPTMESGQSTQPPVETSVVPMEQQGTQAPLQSDTAETSPKQAATTQPKTLQDFEDQAFQALKQKKKNTRTAAEQDDSKAKLLPKGKAKATAKAKAKAQAKATAKTKATPKATAKSPATKRKSPMPMYGCPKCRGNPGGCGQCRDPTYTGMRLPGRETYRDHMAKQKAMRTAA